MSSLTAMFETDPVLEANGITVRYGKNYVRVARAGGANKRFAVALDRVMKPYRRALATGNMDNDVGTDLLHQVYAETVVLGWGNDDHGDGKIELTAAKFKDGVEVKPAEVLSFNKDNVLTVFKRLPALFTDISEQSQAITNYKTEELEAEAKN